MNPKIKRVPQWPLQSAFSFTRYREIGSGFESLIASILISYLDNMVLSMKTEYYSPQFLMKNKSKYFPYNLTSIQACLAKIENSDDISHEEFATALNTNQGLIDEFMYVGKALNVEGFSIEEWIKGASYDLNIVVNLYDQQQLYYTFKQNRFTQALVLSVLMVQNGENYIYGVLYHENYSVFSIEHHNLDYKIEKCKSEMNELQKFEVFAKESLDLIVKDPVSQEICDKMNEIYYKIKPRSRKVWLFEERIARIGKGYVGNVKRCDWCNNCISAVKLECKCLVCFNCIHIYQIKSCLNCSKPFSENLQSELNEIKSTFT